jgi:DivIVA domain-containing protein
MIRPEFGVRRLGPGYRRRDVDAFVDRLVATVDRRPIGDPLTRADVLGAQFGAVLAGGYDIEQVDKFLDDALAWLPKPPPSALPTYERPLFTPVRLREGYDPMEVDMFLDRLFATLEGRSVDRSVTAGEVRKVQFTPVRLREGYDPMEVDMFLEKAEAWLLDR